MLLSVIVPCFNEEAAVPLFYEAIKKTIEEMKERWKELEAEFLFIDDGSSDGTLSEIRALRKSDERVRFVSFSRNFGKEAGIYAGLENSAGDYVVIMDVDLQDPPALLPEMFSLVYEEGYDSAATRRVTRKGEPAIRSFFARQFYKLINRISETEIMDGARDYRIMTRQMVDAILSLSEVNRFTKGIYGWVGFKTKWIEFENVERVAGETKWSFWKLFQYALEGIMAFSTTPLSIATWFGILMSFFAFLFIIVIILRQVLHLADSAYGWSSLVCIILLISGIQLFSIGVVGQYLSKTYLETKRRPLFIAKEKT